VIWRGGDEIGTNKEDPGAVDRTANNDGTALLDATVNGQVEIVGYLWDQGADIHMPGVKVAGRLKSLLCSGHVFVTKLR